MFLFKRFLPGLYLFSFACSDTLRQKHTKPEKETLWCTTRSQQQQNLEGWTELKSCIDLIEVLNHFWRQKHWNLVFILKIDSLLNTATESSKSKKVFSSVWRRLCIPAVSRNKPETFSLLLVFLQTQLSGCDDSNVGPSQGSTLRLFCFRKILKLKIWTSAETFSITVSSVPHGCIFTLMINKSSLVKNQSSCSLVFVGS